MTTLPILQLGHLEVPAGTIPELRLPPSRLYADRGQRFRQLADRHSLADYLRFLAALTDWQQDELDHHPDIPLPDLHLLEHCRVHAMPPLAVDGWERHASWRDSLRRAVVAVKRRLPPSGRKAIIALEHAEATWLEIQADALVRRRNIVLDLAAAPIIGAALQVQWTYLAQKLNPPEIGRPKLPTLCPVCGSHPVASIIRTAGAFRGLRYLHCSLCSTEWHVVRATCSQCGNTKNIGYYGLADAATAVQAEACPACRTYLKIIHQEKDAQADPVTDDIATVALDLLMDEQSHAASGNNLYLVKDAHPE